MRADGDQRCGPLPAGGGNNGLITAQLTGSATVSGRTTAALTITLDASHDGRC